MRRRRSRRKSSAAARKGWNTRTRRQGLRQVGKAVIGRSNPAISTFRFLKETSIGAYKIATPSGYRRNRIVKEIDKHI